MDKATKRNLFICFSGLAFFLILGITSCMKKDKNMTPNNKEFSWPAIDFTFDTSALTIGEEVQFEAVARDGSSKITKWEWTFSNSSEIITGSNPTYTYQKPGSYKVTLTGTDSSGIIDEVSKDLIIKRKDTGIFIKVMVCDFQPEKGLTYSEFYSDLGGIINQYKPDFVVFREADNNNGRNGYTEAAELIGDATGMQALFAKQQNYRGGGYGTAVMSRYPVLDAKVALLPTAAGFGGETKSVGIQTVKLDDKGHTMVFAGMELEIGHEENRIAQTGELLTHFKDIDAPVILAGGFRGEAEGGDVFTALADAGFSLGCSKSDGCPIDHPDDQIYQNVFYRPAEDFLHLKTYVLPETIYLRNLAIIAEFRYYPPLN